MFLCGFEKALMSYSFAAYGKCHDSCYRGWSLVRRELKTAFPKRMRARVMIGETLSSEVEISGIIEAINSISTPPFVQNMAAGLLPRSMDSISRLDDAYFNEI